MMKISKKQIRNISVISPVDNLMNSINSKALQNEVRESVLAGNKNILINLSGVNSIESSGIGELLTLNALVSKQGGQLKLCSLSPKVQDLFKMTNQNRVFEIFVEEQKAINSF